MEVQLGLLNNHGKVYNEEERPGVGDAPNGDSMMEQERQEVTLFFKGEDLVFPETGLKRRLTIFGSICGMAAFAGAMKVSGVVENHIPKHQLQNVPPSTIDWISTLSLFAFWGSGIIYWSYFYMHGLRGSVIAGAILHVAGQFAMANSSKAWHFIVSYSFVLGSGDGLFFIPVSKVLAHYFSKNRGAMLALFFVFLLFSGAVYPIILDKFNALQNDNNPNYGFVWGMRTCGLIDILLMCITVSLFPKRAQPSI